MTRLREALRELPDAAFADVLESDDAYRYVLDVPGATTDTVELTAGAATLSVRATREDAPTDARLVSEERARTLTAEVPLPPDASADGADASVERGVLEVTLPKREAAGTAVEVEEQ